MINLPQLLYVLTTSYEGEVYTTIWTSHERALQALDDTVINEWGDIFAEQMPNDREERIRMYEYELDYFWYTIEGIYVDGIREEAGVSQYGKEFDH